MQWPSQSQDLNLIEMPWQDIKRAVYKLLLNLNEQKQPCNKERDNILPQRCERLINIILPRRELSKRTRTQSTGSADKLYSSTKKKGNPREQKTPQKRDDREKTPTILKSYEIQNDKKPTKNLSDEELDRLDYGQRACVQDDQT